jgi:hypothetical protein
MPRKERLHQSTSPAASAVAANSVHTALLQGCDVDKGLKTWVHPELLEYLHQLCVIVNVIWYFSLCIPFPHAHALEDPSAYCCSHAFESSRLQETTFALFTVQNHWWLCLLKNHRCYRNHPRSMPYKGLYQTIARNTYRLAQALPPKKAVSRSNKPRAQTTRTQSRSMSTEHRHASSYTGCHAAAHHFCKQRHSMPQHHQFRGERRFASS